MPRIAEAVAGAENREAIRGGVYDTAEEAGVSEELKLEIERALSPIESSWELSHQMGRCLEMMEAFNIPVYSAQGYEADDVIGALSVQAAEQGIDTYLVTLDSDLVQLIRDDVTIYMIRPYQRDHVLYDEETATERYGFAPTLMADYKALRGDSSDNIPGVPGIGDGTATKLLTQYPGIEAIFEHLEEVKPDKLRENLRVHEAQVREALDMATIRIDVPDIALEMDEAVVGRYDRQRVLDLLRDLEFRTLVPRLPPVDQTGPAQQAWQNPIPMPQAAATPPPLRQRGGGRGEGSRPTTASSTPKPTSTRSWSACASAAASPSTSRASATTRTTAASSASPSPARPARPTTCPWATSRRSRPYCDTIDDSPSPSTGRGPGGGVTQLPDDMVLGRLAPLFADESIEKVAHAGKFDLAQLTSRGIDTRGFAFDTLLAAYVLGEGALGDTFRAGAGSLSLKWLISRRLGYEMKEIVDLVGKAGAKQTPIDRVSHRRRRAVRL